MVNCGLDVINVIDRYGSLGVTDTCLLHAVVEKNII